MTDDAPIPPGPRDGSGPETPSAPGSGSAPRPESRPESLADSRRGAPADSRAARRAASQGDSLEAREARLAEALRANLRRRKDRARAARAAPPTDASGGEDEA